MPVVYTIAELLTNPTNKIANLKLYNNVFDNDCGDVLARALAHNTTLTSLNLSRMRLTFATLKSLIPVDLSFVQAH